MGLRCSARGTPREGSYRRLLRPGFSRGSKEMQTQAECKTTKVWGGALEWLGLWSNDDPTSCYSNIDYASGTATDVEVRISALYHRRTSLTSQNVGVSA